MDFLQFSVKETYMAFTKMYLSLVMLPVLHTGHLYPQGNIPGAHFC